MPSVSRKQQKLFGQAWAVRQGELSREDAWPAAVRIADSDITNKDLEDFASTSHKGLPEVKRKKKRSIKESYIMMFEDFGRRVAINDLSDPEKVKSKILNEIIKVYRDLTSDEKKEIYQALGDVMFDFKDLSVELHNGPMYEITDITGQSNEDLADGIKTVLIELKEEVPVIFESVVTFVKEEHSQKGVNRAIDLVEVINFLNWVSEDEQMKPDHENYVGFLNLSTEDFSSGRETNFKDRLKRKDLKKQLQTFINLFNSDKDFCTRIMRYLGLNVEPNPSTEETIFHRI